MIQFADHTGKAPMLPELLQQADEACSPIVVAEIGASHGGDLNVATKLVDAAAIADADVVKLQCGVSQLCESGHPLYDTLRANEMTAQMVNFLSAYIRTKRMAWAASVFSVEWLEIVLGMSIPPAYIKIASGDADYIEWVGDVADAYPHIVLSVGGCTAEEIRTSIETVRKGAVNESLVVLACTLAYPCEDHDANVARMKTIRRMFGEQVNGIGYSDHTVSGAASAVATKKHRACMVEKHIALEDQGDSSSTPEQFRGYVANVRNRNIVGDLDVLQGTAGLVPAAVEIPNLAIARRDKVKGVRVA